MSQNETIEFACPSCNTGLRVPAQLAGVTGPCPHCQASIVAPHPVPAVPYQEPVQASPVPTPPQQQNQGAQSHSKPAQAHTARIPAERPTGQVPHSQKVETASKPTPARAIPKDAPPVAPVDQKPSKRRKIWPSIIFPSLFLILSAVVVYLILDLMGILNFDDKNLKEKESETLSLKAPDSSPSSSLVDSTKTSTPSTEVPIMIETPEPADLSIPTSTAPSSTPSLKHDPQDLNKAGELDSDLPDLALKRTERANDSIQKRANAIKEAQNVLKRFLDAQTYDERKPLLTRSDRSEEELANTSLGKPFPKSYFPEVLTVREKEADRAFEVFFSVAFDQPNEDRPKIILIRTVSYSEEDSPKIHTDPFIDLYEEKIQTFSNTEETKTGTFSSLVEFSAFCYDDIPRSESMAKISFFTNLSATAKPIAFAYLNKESNTFKKLEEMEKLLKTRVPATISVAWDTETDPKRPYLQVIRIEAVNWTL